MAIQKSAVWIPVTAEMLADAEGFGGILIANLEYDLLDPKPLLTLVERLTGLRQFTARNGVTIDVRVGWRADLWATLREFAREAWPEDYADDDDD